MGDLTIISYIGRKNGHKIPVILPNHNRRSDGLAATKSRLSQMAVKTSSHEERWSAINTSLRLKNNNHKAFRNIYFLERLGLTVHSAPEGVFTSSFFWGLVLSLFFLRHHFFPSSSSSELFSFVRSAPCGTGVMEFTTEREPVKIPEQDALFLSSIRLKFLPKSPICRNLMPVSGLSDTRPGSSDQRGKGSCGDGKMQGGRRRIRAWRHASLTLLFP